MLSTKRKPSPTAQHDAAPLPFRKKVKLDIVQALRAARTASGDYPRLEESAHDPHISPSSEHVPKLDTNDPEHPFQSTWAPPIVTCGHSIHPAYADCYAKSHCPKCLLDVCLANVRHTQNIIFEHGGTRNWWADALEDGSQEDLDEYRKVVFGRRRQGNENVSYRYRRVLLMKLVNELEHLAQLEQEWPSLHIGTNHGSELSTLYGAEAAMHEYLDAADLGIVGAVERRAASWTRHHGRDMEVSILPALPKNFDFFRNVLKFSMLEAKWLDASKIPSVEEADARALQRLKLRPRKPRRTLAAVSFHQEVYVRAEADIDVLRRSTDWLTQASLDKTSREDTPVRGTHSDASIDASYQTPKASHYTIPLKSEGTFRRHSKTYSRTREIYEPGRWAVSEGYDMVDTSGARKTDEKHEEYTKSIQEEVVDMDAEEAEAAL